MQWSKTRDEPSSFLLGLLVAEAYHRSCNKDAGSVGDTLKDMVRNHMDLRYR